MPNHNIDIGTSNAIDMKSRCGGWRLPMRACDTESTGYLNVLPILFATAMQRMGGDPKLRHQQHRGHEEHTSWGKQAALE